MTRYIIRRCLWGVALLILVSALLFVMFRVLPTADPAKLRAGRLQNPKIIAEIRADLGLDKPLFTQFWVYMKGIFLHFNLGYSYYSTAPVKDLIASRIPATLSLVLGGAVVWLVSGLTVGIISARRPRLAPRPLQHGRRARARVGARILARPDLAVPVRGGHRQVEDLPRRRQLRAADERPRGNGSPR